jgi:hypothetical protein
MESQPANRTAWVAIGILGVAILLAVAIIFDLGPFADGELSEAEFLASGDEICAEAHADFEDLQDSPPRTASEAAELTDELLAISREELDGIRELDGPASLDPALDRYLNAREAGIDELRAGEDAAKGGDALAYAEAQAELASGQLERRELAAKVGFDECSQVLFGREQLEADSQPPLNTDPSAPPTVNNPPTGTP